MVKQFGENLLKWQNYAHYVLLAGFIFIIHWLSDITGVEAAAINSGGIAWVWLLLFYAAGLFIADSLIHGAFWYGPKWMRWRD